MKMIFSVLLIAASLQNFATQVEEMHLPPAAEVLPQNHWHPYVKGGVFLIMPTLGVGTQYRSNQHGCDLSVVCAVLLLPSPYIQTFIPSGHALYQYYAQDFFKGFYAGAGAGIVYIYGEGLITFPEVNIGYEWPKVSRTSPFLQLEVAVAVDGLGARPFPTISSGFRF